MPESLEVKIKCVLLSAVEEAEGDMEFFVWSLSSITQDIMSLVNEETNQMMPSFQRITPRGLSSDQLKEQEEIKEEVVAKLEKEDIIDALWKKAEIMLSIMPHAERQILRYYTGCLLGPNPKDEGSNG